MPNITIENNLVWAANGNIPGGVMNLAAGDMDTIVADFADGDFTPSLLTRQSGFVPRLPFDRNRAEMPDPVAPGALAYSANALALFAPEITSNEITGTPADGAVLTATWTASGTMPITPAYQWQRNGTNIPGQTAQTITLNAVTMGLVNGDTISCEITLTNAGGSATAEPTATFGNNLIQQIAATSACLAVYDWTDTAAMTAGDGGAVVQGAGDKVAVVPNAKTPGTLNRIQAVGASQPTYNNGPIYDGAGDYMQSTFAANTGPSNAVLVYLIKTSDNQFCLGGSNSGSFYAGMAEDGLSSAPHGGTGFTGATYWANGTQITTVTRDGLHTAWATGAPVVAEVHGLNYQNASITDIRDRWAASTYYVNGLAALIAILDGNAAEFASALALVRQEAERLKIAWGL
ncbi:MAG: hypothetical protein ACK4RT_07530 [Erythrobacter sp.]